MVASTTTSEKKLLNIIVRLSKEGEPNITNKRLVKESGYSKGYVSKLLNKLREKNLIETADQKIQKVHQPTMEGAMAVLRVNGGSSDVETPMETPMETQRKLPDYDPEKKEWKLRIRPHDFRFQVEILKGPSKPFKTFKTYEIKGRVDKIVYKYDVTLVFMESKKSKRRWVQIYVPQFFSDDLKLCTLEAHKTTLMVLRHLKKEHGYEFADPVLTHSHIAVTGDPFTRYLEDEVGLVRDKDGRIQIDKSPGYHEFEAITKLGQEDMELVFNEVLNPILKREFSLISFVKGIRRAQQQIRTDQLIFSQNQRVFGENLKEHVKLVTALETAGSQLEKATSILIDLVQKDNEQKKEESGFLKKIKQSGQKFLEDFL